MYSQRWWVTFFFFLLLLLLKHNYEFIFEKKTFFLHPFPPFSFVMMSHCLCCVCTWLTVEAMWILIVIASHGHTLKSARTLGLSPAMLAFQ